VIIVDASIALAWIYPDERDEIAERALDAVVLYGGLVPTIWHLEVANSLAQGVRRRRLTAPQRDLALVDFARFNIEIDPDTSRQAWSVTLPLAERFVLTGYDAAYLELALRRRLPLATLDRDLRRAARESGVELLGGQRA
jgi:predicted nucleic acid-binding protein